MLGKLRKKLGDYSPVIIQGNIIVQVDTFKYLGVVIDYSLTWKAHTNYLCSRFQQRLYFLRRLMLFGVSQKIMLLFYQAVLGSLLNYGMQAWYGNLSVRSKSQLVCLVKVAMKVIGVREYTPLQSIYESLVLKNAQTIVSDSSHVLFSTYQLLPSGNRYRVPLCKCNRYKNSFIPVSIKVLNIRL